MDLDPHDEEMMDYEDEDATMAGSPGTQPLEVEVEVEVEEEVGGPAIEVMPEVTEVPEVDLDVPVPDIPVIDVEIEPATDLIEPELVPEAVPVPEVELVAELEPSRQTIAALDQPDVEVRDLAEPKEEEIDYDEEAEVEADAGTASVPQAEASHAHEPDHTAAPLLEEEYYDEELPPLAPILIHVPGLGSRALFSPVEEDEADAPALPVYLAGRDELAEEGLNVILAALREELEKEGVAPAAEFVLVEKMMDLHMGEVSPTHFRN